MKRSPNCTRQCYANEAQANLYLRKVARNRHANTHPKPREPRYCSSCRAWHLVPSIHQP